MLNKKTYNLLICMSFVAAMANASGIPSRNNSIKISINDSAPLRGPNNDSDDHVSRQVLVRDKCYNISKLSSVENLFSHSWNMRKDKCIILYNDFDCVGLSTKFVLPDKFDWTNSTIDSLSKYTHGHFSPMSFSGCKDLPVDLKTKTNIWDRLFSPNIPFMQLTKSENVLCTCLNIGNKSEHSQEFLNNNDYLFGYFEQDCGSSVFAPIRIPVGNSPNFINKKLGQNKQNGNNYKILSVGPDVASKHYQNHCISLHATLETFTFIENRQSSKTDMFKLPVGSVFIDNFNDVRVHDFIETSWDFRNTLELKIDNTLDNVKSVKVAGCSYMIKDEIPSRNKKSIIHQFGTCNALKKAFNRDKKWTSSTMNTIIEEKIIPFKINSKLVVPECTHQMAIPYIKTLTNNQITFNGVAAVTGRVGNRVMTAAEIKSYMGPEKKYAGTKDFYTLLVVVAGSAKTNYGISTLVNITNIPAECVTRSNHDTGMQ